MRLLIIALLIIISGCSPYKPVIVKETITEIIKETVHDTVFKIEKDSSSYKALLDCQNGKITIKEIKKVQSGKNITPPKVAIENNELTVDCEVRAQELFAQWISKHKDTLKIGEKPIYIEYDPGFFDIVQIWLGRLFIIILLLYLAFKQIKNKLKR